MAIAHDWLIRYAGSERCVSELLRAFPDAALVTTLLRPGALPAEFDRATPSLLQHLPGATSHHEWLLPLMPAAWALRRPLSGFDAVISSSHACAKAVRIERGTPHICYCHTPMRYAWDFDAEAARFPRRIRPIARAGMAAFRRWDRGTAGRVTQFVANSRAVAERIERFYGREAVVVHPPVRTDFFTPGAGARAGFLYVGRLVGYKRADLVVEAFRELPHELTVVGAGHLAAGLRARATPNIRFVPSVDDEELRRLYRSALALVFPADEDFGIAMAEAQAAGTPVIALARGGAVDIVEPDRTGWLLASGSVEELRETVRLAASQELDHTAISRRAQRFSSDRYREEMRSVVDAALA